MAWSERENLDSFVVDEQGVPYPESVEAWERFVEALQKALQPQYRGALRFAATNYPGAEKPFKRLVEAGG
jgi:hypothetical protein